MGIVYRNAADGVDVDVADENGVLELKKLLEDSQIEHGLVISPTSGAASFSSQYVIATVAFLLLFYIGS